MRPTAVLVLLLIGSGIAVPASADTWCATNHPDAVSCDDFDGYASGDAFYDEWVKTGPCSSELMLDTDYYSSEPWSGKMNTQENGTLGFSVNAISDVVRNHFGPTCSSGSVIGTDLNPLILELVMNGQTTNKGRYDNSFLTLTSGWAYAPTDWAWSEFCEATSPDPRYPVICQQETPITACPPIGDAPSIPAIAVGFLAYLDNNPCHVGESWKSPINEHLSFFDGRKWYRLRQGLFPGSGDFMVRSLENRIKVTIRSSTVKVELTCPETSEYSWCELPAAYSGPFNALNAGFHWSCQLKTDEWVCRDTQGCDYARGVPGGGVPRYDNIVLHGGVCDAPPGACCIPGIPYTCSEEYAGDCETLGGAPQASGTSCDSVACCPRLSIDYDLDGDVDSVDFGWFQTCFSGHQVPVSTPSCRCADLDNDGDVEQADFTIFHQCLGGPGVLVDVSCLD